jgi:hypothetical protein
MIKYHQFEGKVIIAEITDDHVIISETQDMVDLMGEVVFNNCTRIIIHEENLHPDFFNLKTRLAGDILQKFSNYRVKLAIIGDFSKFKSKSLGDFIRECNKGNMVFFTTSFEEALNKLTGVK